MATRLERYQESLNNYKQKIIEIEDKIQKEKDSLIAKRAEAEAKLAEAKAKFEAIYGGLPTMEDAQEESTNKDEVTTQEDADNSLFPSA